MRRSLPHFTIPMPAGTSPKGRHTKTVISHRKLDRSRRHCQDYLERVFGKPDKTVRAPKPANFSGMKGIIVVKGHGWVNAKGHVTLWDGSGCSDTCHLMRDPENGPFVPEIASLWVLK
ncbi:MAG TPA: T6SS effector amidase Tae4 family protein [Telluria sp.]